ncbi:MAG: transposase, partial [Verrucomicrobia bacterium]|nr:transposase [Verrucomicrobiota bacterium]
MARKVRFEQAGGFYHVINRGNYRSWVFETEGSRKSFEKTLLEACKRSGWILHAYCVMGNHYHLAVETPEPNLSEGCVGCKASSLCVSIVIVKRTD